MSRRFVPQSGFCITAFLAFFVAAAIPTDDALAAVVRVDCTPNNPVKRGPFSLQFDKDVAVPHRDGEPVEGVKFLSGMPAEWKDHPLAMVWTAGAWVVAAPKIQFPVTTLQLQIAVYERGVYEFGAYRPGGKFEVIQKGVCTSPDSPGTNLPINPDTK